MMTVDGGIGRFCVEMERGFWEEGLSLSLPLTLMRFVMGKRKWWRGEALHYNVVFYLKINKV